MYTVSDVNTQHGASHGVQDGPDRWCLCDNSEKAQIIAAALNALAPGGPVDGLIKAADALPLMVEQCIGRGIMRFRAGLDRDEPEHDDPEGYLRSCLVALMHYANSEGLDFAGDLEWAQSAFAEDGGHDAPEILCHGYDLEECRDHFVPEGVELSDEQLRELMTGISDNGWIDDRGNEARFEAMQEAFQSLIDELHLTPQERTSCDETEAATTE